METLRRAIEVAQAASGGGPDPTLPVPGDGIKKIRFSAATCRRLETPEIASRTVVSAEPILRGDPEYSVGVGQEIPGLRVAAGAERRGGAAPSRKSLAIRAEPVRAVIRANPKQPRPILENGVHCPAGWARSEEHTSE